MKSVKKYYRFVVFLSFCFSAAATQTVSAQIVLSPQDKQVYTDFEKRAQEYVKLREGLEKKLPKLPTDATPAQIESHKMNLQKSVQAARTVAKKGEIFTPAAEQLIRTMIAKNFQGSSELSELQEGVMETGTKGVALQVNFPYPDTKEEVEIPPALLLVLPQLPKELRFRFVGANLLLIDTENELILDYMTNALPLKTTKKE